MGGDRCRFWTRDIASLALRQGAAVRVEPLKG
jgi:hypothetical protein